MTVPWAVKPFASAHRTSSLDPTGEVGHRADVAAVPRDDPTAGLGSDAAHSCAHGFSTVLLSHADRTAGAAEQVEARPAGREESSRTRAAQSGEARAGRDFADVR